MGRQMIRKMRRALSLTIDNELFMHLVAIQPELGFSTFTAMAERALEEFLVKHSRHPITHRDELTAATHPSKIRFTDPGEPIEMLADRDAIAAAAADTTEVEIVPTKSDILELLRKSQT